MPVLGISANRSASPQIRKSTTSLGWFLRFPKKYVLTIKASTGLGGYISEVQHPLTKFLRCETIISKSTATRTAKWIGLRSRNFQRLVFRREKNFLKWQRAGQDNFDDMPSSSSQ